MDKLQKAEFNGTTIEVGKSITAIVSGVTGPVLISDEVVGILAGAGGAFIVYTLLGRAVRLFPSTGEGSSQTTERRKRR